MGNDTAAPEPLEPIYCDCTVGHCKGGPANRCAHVYADNRIREELQDITAPESTIETLMAAIRDEICNAEADPDIENAVNIAYDWLCERIEQALRNAGGGE